MTMCSKLPRYASRAPTGNRGQTPTDDAAPHLLCCRDCNACYLGGGLEIIVHILRQSSLTIDTAVDLENREFPQPTENPIFEKAASTRLTRNPFFPDSCLQRYPLLLHLQTTKNVSTPSETPLLRRRGSSSPVQGFDCRMHSPKLGLA